MKKFNDIIKTTGYTNLRTILEVLIADPKMTKKIRTLIDYIIAGANGNAYQLSESIIKEVSKPIQYSNSCRIYNDLTGKWNCSYYTEYDYQSKSGTSEQSLIKWAKEKGFNYYFVGNTSTIIYL